MDNTIKNIVKEELQNLNEDLNKISLQTAVDKQMFGPVYHGTTEEYRQEIEKTGFKVFVGAERGENIRHGYPGERPYAQDTPPPIHHLGFGIYFTTVKTIAKRFNVDSSKGIKTYYLDVPRLATINYASPKRMMEWWVANGYDQELAKQGQQGRIDATMKLTENLKKNYDAVWFKGKTLYRVLDGDQIVVFDPNKIYQIDNTLAGELEIGSKVKRTEDRFDYQYSYSTVSGESRTLRTIPTVAKGTIGVIIGKASTESMLNQWHNVVGRTDPHWAEDSKFVYRVKWSKGGTEPNVLDKHIEPVNKQKNISEDIRNITDNDIVVTKGTELYHGTIEDFDKKNLHTGGYDQIFWTTKDTSIAQTYIPQSGIRVYTSSEHLARPTEDPTTRNIQKVFGIEYDYSKVEFENHRATSYMEAPVFKEYSDNYWRISDATYKKYKEFEDFKKDYNQKSGKISAKLEDLYLKKYEILEREYNELREKQYASSIETYKNEYINAKLQKLGYEPTSTFDSNKNFQWKLKIDDDTIQRADYKAKGRVLIAIPKRDLKIYDTTNRGRREGDLTDLDYHKHNWFQMARENGYDGIKINDFAQSEDQGNLGHTSIGLFRNTLKDLDIQEFEAVHNELEPHFQSGDWQSPEYKKYKQSVQGTIQEEIQKLHETTYKVYHGTNNQFDKFDFNRATQGIVWFTDNIDSIKNQTHGGAGNKYIMTRYITINNPAGWDEYEKYGLQQLEDMGYDGVILPQGDKTDYFVFSNKSIRKIEPKKVTEDTENWYPNRPTISLYEETTAIEKGDAGDCYKNVQDYLLDNDIPNAYIVHGVVTSRNGTLNHAWIETDNEVYDPTTGIKTDKETYYAKLNPKVEARYTFPEAMKKRFATGQYGPWSESLNELRYIQGYHDIENNVPLRDDETIIVYHGFSSHSFTDALLTAKHGISGQERASRIYSYEYGNNPKGLFISVNFQTVERNFSGSGIIMEFATKVSNLEAPVWVGGRSYYVQGEYTQSFKDDAERQQQQLLNREKHTGSEYQAIANSDRPELAWALYEGPEAQALFVGNLNPNMIRAFWVNETLIKDKRTGGKWERLSRADFLKKYYNDEYLQTQKYDYSKKEYVKDYPEKYYDKESKIFLPNEDFNIDKLKDYMVKHQYDYDDFIDYVIKHWDNHLIHKLFYPKQIVQLKKHFGIEDVEPETPNVPVERKPVKETNKAFVKRMLYDYFKTKKIIDLPLPFRAFKEDILNFKPEYREYFDSLSGKLQQDISGMLYIYHNKLEQIQYNKQKAQKTQVTEELEELLGYKPIHIYEEVDNPDIDVFQRVADNLQKEPIPSANKYILVNVDMQLADDAFKRDTGYYIGKDDKGILNRRLKVRDLIKTGELKYAPIVNIIMNNYGQPLLSFTDGRHRFAELRDAGVKTINLAVRQEAKKYIPLLQKDNSSLAEINQKDNSKKIYYHGRKMGGRPYSGSYIFISDNLGYASGYSDGEKLYTYTIPFGEDKIFSIKNPAHLKLLRKQIDDYTIEQIQKVSNNEEIDWAALSYIGTDKFENPEDLFQYLGFFAIRLKERTGIESIYVFNEHNLNFEGEIDIRTPEMIQQIGQFYQDFTKDKNFLEEKKKMKLPIMQLPILGGGMNESDYEHNIKINNTDNEELVKIKNFLNSSEDERYNALKADSDHVYVFRATSVKAEIDDILNGGSSGSYWSSRADYFADYILVAKDRITGNHKSYMDKWDFREKIPARDENNKTYYDEEGHLVYTKNPNQRNPDKFIDTFNEVGAYRTLDEIDYIIHAPTGKVIYPIQDSENIINEVGEANVESYPYTTYESSTDIYYEFKTDDDDNYTVTFLRANAPAFKHQYIYEVEFKVYGYKDSHHVVVNKGRLYEVMATITKIVKEFIQEVKPNILYFQPTKNKGDFDLRRMNLYLAYIKKAALENSDYIFDGTVDYALIISKKFIDPSRLDDLLAFESDMRIRQSQTSSHEADMIEALMGIMQKYINIASKQNRVDYVPDDES